jgi:two-component system, NtrC family, response regulator HydG
MLPDDVSTKLQGRTSSLGRVYSLRVLDGPSAGRPFEIGPSTPGRVYIGHSAKCEIVIDDPLISRRHAALAVQPQGLVLTDLDSANGTWVNGVRVFSAALDVGAVLRLGETTLRLEAASELSSDPLPAATSFGRVIGASEAMRRLYPILELLARSDVSVVIEGETGTGKEVVAESIHEASERDKGPFIVFDCTAVPATLVESELFGHERGAFTGALSARKGLFEQANGGTLLIDEIGDLDAALQPKLLRALQRGEVRRVGGSAWIKVDVRVLAATRRDLEREVQEGRFRDDLFFRLAVARIELPPLRDRLGDVAVLAAAFWRELGGAGEPAYELVERLERHSWPGNVRELNNAIARYLALGEQSGGPGFGPSGNSIRGGDLIAEVIAMQLPFPRARDKVLEEFERRYLEQMLAMNGGNVTRAAEAAGIGRRYFTQIAARHAK